MFVDSAKTRLYQNGLRQGLKGMAHLAAKPQRKRKQQKKASADVEAGVEEELTDQAGPSAEHNSDEQAHPNQGQARTWSSV